MYPVSARFLDAISGSHRAVARVQVLPTTFGQFPQFGPNPTGGVELPLLDGDVQLTSTADVNGTVDFTISGDYWELLQPYGAELFVERGVDFGDGTRELVPCGYYGIEEISQDSAPAGPVQVSGADRAKRLQRNRVIYPIEFPAGTTHAEIFQSLVNGVRSEGATDQGYPLFIGGTVPVAFTGYDPNQAKIGSSLTVEDDAHAFLSKIADARQCVLRFARTGELLVQPRNIPPGAVPVYAVAPGAGGNLISASRKVTRDGFYNFVVARGSDPANVTSYRLAYNNEAGSPLRWDGPFGVVPRYYASPLLLTNESADVAAETILARYKGLPSSLSLMAVPNPALDPLDVVQATFGGASATHLTDQVGIPLVGSQPVQIVTRTLNEIPAEGDVPGGVGTPNPANPGSGGGGSTATTAAERYGWGAPLGPSDDFTAGTLDTSKWAVLSGAGYSGNGRRLPARAAIVNNILTLTGLENGDTAGLAHRFDQQYGRWEIRVRSYRSTTTGGGGGGTPPAQVRGVGGVATPAGAIVATGNTTSALNISSGGTASNPKVYDGAGNTCGRINITADYVTVQNYRVVANNQYGIVVDSCDNVIVQNCDIKGVKPTGDGDLNAFTIWGCTNLKIRYNTAVNFVAAGVDVGDSHTDWLQTWVSSSHPVPCTNVEIVNNLATGPANPSRDGSIPSIHQWIMVESAGRGGNSGGSGTPSNWLICDNTVSDSWNQCVKTDNGNNFVFTRNEFVGSSDRVFQLGGSGHVVWSDNEFGAGYGSINATVTSGSGPAPSP